MCITMISMATELEPLENPLDPEPIVEESSDEELSWSDFDESSLELFLDELLDRPESPTSIINVPELKLRF